MKYEIFAALLLAAPAFAGDNISYGKFITSGPKSRPYVALTFDDGPGDATEDVLKLLDAYGAKATFFVLGGQAARNPKLLEEEAKAGHLVANHTYTHSNFNKVPEEKRVSKLESELERTSDIIKKHTGYHTRFMRMPYGITKKWVLQTARRNKYVVVNWDYGSDWESRPKEELLKKYLASLTPGAILLLHDGGDHRQATVYIVRRVLEEAKKRRLVPVRLDTLLDCPENNAVTRGEPSRREESAPEPAAQAASAPAEKQKPSAEPVPAPRKPAPAPEKEKPAHSRRRHSDKSAPAAEEKTPRSDANSPDKPAAPAPKSSEAAPAALPPQNNPPPPRQTPPAPFDGASRKPV
ncbi:MAG: polysaccharide deacetylase family protein [Elusimicrobiales bacterium]